MAFNITSVYLNKNYIYCYILYYILNETLLKFKLNITIEKNLFTFYL